MSKRILQLLLLSIGMTMLLTFVEDNNSPANERGGLNETSLSELHTQRNKQPLSSVPDRIELYEEMETLILQVEDIPTYKDYLTESDNVALEIERTQFVKIQSDSYDSTYALLQYGCGTKACSTLLLETNGVQNRSMIMPYGTFQDYKRSPDQNRLLLRYAYDEGGSVKRQIIVAVDLNSMQVIPYASDSLENEYMLNPTWPILSYQWLDENRFSLKTTEISESDWDALQQWFSSTNRKVKRVEIQLENTAFKKRLQNFNSALPFRLGS